MTKIFKVIFHHKRRYFRKAGFFSGIKNFWCVDSNAEITETFDRISHKNNAKSISTFDFSTLYTKIPHDKLIEVLSSIVDSTYNDTTRKYMSVGNKRAYWVKGIRNTRFLYSMNVVKDCLKFLIKDAYFRVGNLVFRQVNGIGSDPAPFFANLFLFFFESKWINECKKANYGKAKRFLNVFRYIDDLLTLNDDDEFERSFPDIYPPELVLKKENANNNHATFLDLDIMISNDRFDYKLYDKRNSFDFYIVRFPYLCSNMPSKMFYSCITAEILRICRASIQYNYFISAVDPFLKRMTRQGAKRGGVKRSLTKLLYRHTNSFKKYGKQNKVFLDILINLL